jgi:hypothetical protein
MKSPALPIATAAISRRCGLSAKEAHRKKAPAKIQHNPLKSQDSVERIQGNPRESNTPELRYGSERARGQENPNRLDERPPLPEKEPAPQKYKEA